MTKEDLVEAVHQATSLVRRDCIYLVDTTLQILQETLGAGESIKISGFGSFTVKLKRARLGRNPQTGERLEICKRRVLTFQPSQGLRSRMSREGSEVSRP